jgi:hypothetical protein
MNLSTSQDNNQICADRFAAVREGAVRRRPQLEAVTLSHRVLLVALAEVQDALQDIEKLPNE